jgi:hypothetical protein
MYAKLNDYVMAVIYSPLLIVAAYFETRSAKAVKSNRRRGEEDDDTMEEWEQMAGTVDFEQEGWAKTVQRVTPDIADDSATLEVRALKAEIKDLKEILMRFIEGRQGNGT